MIISVFTLTIAYAVLSTTLNITGSAEISGSSWNITVNKYDFSSDFTEDEINDGWKYYYNGFAVGDAELIKEPTISGTTISNMQISFTKPGDLITLTYEVTNNGTIPAKIESIIQNTPSFSSSTNNASDLELISNNFLSEFALLPEDNFNWVDKLDTGYVLCPGETIYLDYSALFDDNATAVSSSNITISNLGGSINFVQADKSTCSSS